jgi:tRNA-intron lyase
MNKLIKLTKNNRYGIIKDNDLKSELSKKKFGFKKDLDFYLDLFEIYYLFNKKKIKIKNYNNKSLSKKELLKICNTKIKDFEDKYIVFCDFRDQGKIVKDGTSFGFDFRVYNNTQKHSHTIYVVDVRKSGKDTINKIIKSERLANTINTKYILAIVNLEKKIIKLKIEREKE